MAHDDDHRKPRMEDWGALNAVPDAAPVEVERRTYRPPPGPPPGSLLPDPDVLVDVPIKSHRSYAGLVFLVVIALAGVGLYYVMSTDLSSERVRGNPEGIKLGGQQNLTAVGAAPEDIEVAPPPRKTLLRINTVPEGARVVVNGNPHGNPTPTAVQTFVGQPVRVHAYAEGRLPVLEELTITGAEQTITLELPEAEGKPAVGVLDVTSDPPGAFLTYNGVVVGETPLKLEAVPAGHPVFFRLQKEGHYDHTVRYEVGDGETRRVGVRMVPEDGERTMSTITVEAIPLVVRVDRVVGSKTDREGTTGNRPVQVFGRIGHPIVLQGSASGHGKDRVAIDVVDPNYTVLMRLPPPKKVYGTITLTGPKNLTVYLDGNELDPLPLKKLEKMVGEHKLVVVDPETRARATVTLTLAEDEHVEKAISRTDDGRIVIE